MKFFKILEKIVNLGLTTYFIVNFFLLLFQYEIRIVKREKKENTTKQKANTATEKGEIPYKSVFDD